MESPVAPLERVDSVASSSILGKANNSADQSNSDGPNQHNDGPDAATHTEPVHWEVDGPPPLPEARGSKEILKDLKDLIPTRDKFEALDLAREQLFAPPVMLHLAGEYYVKFGGPELVRGPMDAGDPTDSRDIHLTLSNLTKPANSRFQKNQARLPSFVFDIGRLYLINKSSAYQPTNYRVVLDVVTGEIWLLFEYYQIDLDNPAKKVQYLKENILEMKVQKRFDSAMVLDSIKRWDDSLTVEVMEWNMIKTGVKSGTYMTPATVQSVEDLLVSQRIKGETFMVPERQDSHSKGKRKATIDVQSLASKFRLPKRVRPNPSKWTDIRLPFHPHLPRPGETQPASQLVEAGGGYVMGR